MFSTVYLCWGALAGLNCRYGVCKVDFKEKLSGVFPQYLQDEYCIITNGFDEISLQPHLRVAGVVDADGIADNPDLQTLTWARKEPPPHCNA